MASKEFEAEVAEQYRSIGQFIVAFEECNEALRSSILQYLHGCGLRSQRVGHILINNKSSTASQLILLYDAITAELGFKDEEAQKKVFDRIRKDFTELTENRNLIVHKNWAIGWQAVGSPEPPKMMGLKGNPKKSGMTFDVGPNSVAKILDLVKDAKRIRDLINLASHCLMLQSVGKGKFDRYFRWDKNGILRANKAN